MQEGRENGTPLNLRPKTLVFSGISSRLKEKGIFFFHINLYMNVLVFIDTGFLEAKYLQRGVGHTCKHSPVKHRGESHALLSVGTSLSVPLFNLLLPQPCCWSLLAAPSRAGLIHGVMISSILTVQGACSPAFGAGESPPVLTTASCRWRSQLVPSCMLPERKAQERSLSQREDNGLIPGGLPCSSRASVMCRGVVAKGTQTTALGKGKALSKSLMPQQWSGSA